MIEGEELALTIGIVSALSFNPLSLAARALTGGTISNDELPTASPTGVYGCARWGPLVGVLAGTRDPSDIGASAASEINDLRRGGPGILVRPLSFLSISARLVLALILLLMRGLKDEPSVSAASRACTCPTTRSSPKGRRGSTLPNSTMPLGPVSWYRVPPLPGKSTKCNYELNMVELRLYAHNRWSKMQLYLCYSRVTLLHFHDWKPKPKWLEEMTIRHAKGIQSQ